MLQYFLRGLKKLSKSFIRYRYSVSLCRKWKLCLTCGGDLWAALSGWSTCRSGTGWAAPLPSLCRLLFFLDQSEHHSAPCSYPVKPVCGQHNIDFIELLMFPFLTSTAFISETFLLSVFWKGLSTTQASLSAFLKSVYTNKSPNLYCSYTWVLGWINEARCICNIYQGSIILTACAKCFYTGLNVCLSKPPGEKKPIQESNIPGYEKLKCIDAPRFRPKPEN